MTIEDDAGALQKAVAQVLVKLGSTTSFCEAEGADFTRMRVVSRVVSAVGPSFRTYDECLRHFGFLPEQLYELLLEDQTDRQ